MSDEPDIIRQHPAVYDAQHVESGSFRESLIAAGRLIPARGKLSSLEPPVDQPHVMSISDALTELRSAG